MEKIFLVVTALPAFAGVYLIADFLLWQVKGHVTGAVIEGFQKRAWLGRPLPVVSYMDGEGNSRGAETERIDQLLYLLFPPEEGAVVAVIVREGRARVYGYGLLVLGILLILPLLAAAAILYGDTLAAVRVAFAAIFAGIVLGGWIGLRLIYGRN